LLSCGLVSCTNSCLVAWLVVLHPQFAEEVRVVLVSWREVGGVVVSWREVGGVLERSGWCPGEKWVVRDGEDGEPDRKRDRAEEEAEEERHRELKLRNYTPEDEELKERQVPKAKPVSVEEKVKEQLDAAKPESVIEEVDLANLAPRKPDWDLKRDVAKKLEKLERRTQKAIAELIRDRLKGSEEELAGAVGAIGVTAEGDSD
uniref:Coiled-coil domain containing 12 n=1 Tax=Oncorhynchus mykiss TaxID=8022 RepID=A0A8C7S036_ONCMY